MAILKIVPKEDWDVLEKYFNKGTGVILVPEPSLEKYFPQAMAKVIKTEDGKNLYYDFGGGDPDFYVDIATTPSHYAAAVCFAEILKASETLED